MTTTDRTIEDATAMLAASLRAKAAERYCGWAGVVIHLQDGNFQHAEDLSHEEYDALPEVEQRYGTADALERLGKILKGSVRPRYYGSAGLMVFLVNGTITRMRKVGRQIVRANR